MRVIDYQEITTRPVRLGALESCRRHPFLVAAPIIVFVAVALLIGLSRQVTYTSQARLTVGRLTVNDPAGIPGLLQASQSLASAYARAVNATPVLEKAAKKLHTYPGAIDGRLGATPIPDSPLIKITGTGRTAREAERIVNAGSSALISYVSGLTKRDRASQQTYERFREAALTYTKRQSRVNQLKGKIGPNPNPDPALKGKLDQAEADEQAALLQRESLRVAYQTGQLSSSSGPQLERFSPATPASSDRTRVLELLAFSGLVAGLALGVALAMTRANRKLVRLARE